MNPIVGPLCIQQYQFKWLSASSKCGDNPTMKHFGTVRARIAFKKYLNAWKQQLGLSSDSTAKPSIVCFMPVSWPANTPTNTFFFSPEFLMVSDRNQTVTASPKRPQLALICSLHINMTLLQRSSSIFRTVNPLLSNYDRTSVSFWQIHMQSRSSNLAPSSLMRYLSISRGQTSLGCISRGILGMKFFTLYLQLTREAARRDMYLPKVMLSSLNLTQMEVRMSRTLQPSMASLSSHQSETAASFSSMIFLAMQRGLIWLGSGDSLGWMAPGCRLNRCLYNISVAAVLMIPLLPQYKQMNSLVSKLRLKCFQMGAFAEAVPALSKEAMSDVAMQMVNNQQKGGFWELQQTYAERSKYMAARRI